MYSSRSLEPMRQKQKFRDDATPINKKRPPHNDDTSDEQDQDISHVVPFWEQEETNV